MNPLENVRKWHKTARDCLRVTTRVIDREIPDAITGRHIFGDYKPAESLHRIQEASMQLQDLVVLSLVAVFEQLIIDNVREALESPGENGFKQKVRDYIVYEAERLRLADMLDLYREIIDKKLIGRVKQIKKYRDWVAHGRNPYKRKPENTSPQNTYEILTEFLEKTGILTSVE